MPLIKYKPLDYQRKFHFSRKPKVYLSGGLGSGKTYSLCMKLFALMSENPNLSGGILCPDLKMFKKDVLPTIREICLENSIPMQFNKSDSIFYFPSTNSTVYVFHAEDYRSIRGPNLAFMLINEVTLVDKQSFDSAVGRVRVKNAGLLQVAMSGTPEGISNWAYEYFIENPREDTDLIFGNTRDNYHVSSTYVKSLEDSYDSKLIEAYVDGKFISMLGNRAAYAFDRFKHLDDKVVLKKELPIWVSIDFNINPMSAVIWNRMNMNYPYTVQAVDEICMEGANTYQLAERIKQLVGTEVVLYPDPAGRAGSTKSNFSDFDILKQAGFRHIKYKSQVSVRDSLNAMNALLDKNQVRIHPKCRNLIADLEQCTIKVGGHELDKSNPKRTHWLDGFKNMCEYEFGIIKPQVVRVGAYA